MSVMTSNAALRSPRPGSLYDVLDLILDKGLVIDAYVRVSLVGIELLTIDARIVVASVDTYLRFAEAANRLELQAQNGTGLPELVGDLQQGGAQHKTRGALEGVKDSVSGLFGGGGDDDEDDEDRDGQRRRGRSRREPQRSRSSSRRSRSQEGDGGRERRDDSGRENQDGDSEDEQ